VLIDIPKDVTAATCEWTSASQDQEEQENPVMRARAIRLSAKNNRTAFSEADLQLAVDLIMSANDPLFMREAASSSLMLRRSSARLQSASMPPPA